MASEVYLDEGGRGSLHTFQYSEGELDDGDLHTFQYSEVYLDEGDEAVCIP